MSSSNLEGRLVLLAGDSDVSRSHRDDIFKAARGDHQYSTRVVKLNSKLVTYSNGNLNWNIESPDGHEMETIQHLLRHGDTHIVTKLENPAFADPLHYHFGALVNKLGKRYVELASIQALSPEKLQSRFASYVETHFPGIMGESLDMKKSENELDDIARTVYTICRTFDKPLRDVFANGHSDNVVSAPELEMFGYALRGFLTDVVQSRPKIIAQAEINHLSSRIGRDFLQQGDIGRFSWLTPFLDLRSDHNKKNPHEGIRVKELAANAADYGVHSIAMLRGHSHLGISHFTERGIDVESLTQTNEYISELLQEHDNLEEMYVLSPDAGGVTDAMVFARELYRRTNGRFSGRVVVLDKKRSGIGEIEGMELSQSYVYNREADTEYDHKDVKGNLIPWDHPKAHAATYKEEGNEHYIGKLFEVEHEADEKEQLAEKIRGHTALIRDDMIASGGTMITAAKMVYSDFDSTSIAMAEHACFTGSAIQKLGMAFEKGILSRVHTSNSIIHPGSREWHQHSPLSGRLYTTIRRGYRDWVGQHFPAFAARLEAFDVRA